MVNRDRRLTFADFLDRLAAATTSPEEWDDMVIEHYADEVLEDIRVRLIRLVIDSPDGQGDRPASPREGFVGLADELRRSIAS